MLKLIFLFGLINYPGKRGRKPPSVSSLNNRGFSIFVIAEKVAAVADGDSALGGELCAKQPEILIYSGAVTSHQSVLYCLWFLDAREC